MFARSFRSRVMSSGVVCLVVAILGVGALLGPAPTPTRADDPTFFYVGTNQRVDRYTASGVWRNSIAQSSPLAGYADIAIGPDGNLYVSTGKTIERYDRTTGAFLGTFIDLTTAGFVIAYHFAFGPDGNLYVGGQFAWTSAGWSKVEKFDGRTGARLGTVIPGLTLPNLSDLIIAKLVFGFDGSLYISVWSFSQRRVVLRYAGDGTLLSVVIPTAGHPAMTIGPDGDLYMIAQPGLQQYDPVTGAVRATWPSIAGLQDITFGPDGKLYGIRQDTNAVFRYDLTTDAREEPFMLPSGPGGAFARVVFYQQPSTSSSTPTDSPSSTPTDTPTRLPSSSATATVSSTLTVTPSSSATATVSSAPTSTVDRHTVPTVIIKPEASKGARGPVYLPLVQYVAGSS